MVNVTESISYLGIMSAAGFMLAPAFCPMVMVTVATVSPIKREGGEWCWSSRLQATSTIRKVARPWSTPSSGCKMDIYCENSLD